MGRVALEQAYARPGGALLDQSPLEWVVRQLEERVVAMWPQLRHRIALEAQARPLLAALCTPGGLLGAHNGGAPVVRSGPLLRRVADRWVLVCRGHVAWASVGETALDMALAYLALFHWARTHNLIGTPTAPACEQRVHATRSTRRAPCVAEQAKRELQLAAWVPSQRRTRATAAAKGSPRRRSLRAVASKATRERTRRESTDTACSALSPPSMDAIPGGPLRADAPKGEQSWWLRASKLDSVLGETGWDGMLGGSNSKAISLEATFDATTDVSALDVLGGTTLDSVFRGSDVHGGPLESNSDAASLGNACFGIGEGGCRDASEGWAGGVDVPHFWAPPRRAAAHLRWAEGPGAPVNWPMPGSGARRAPCADAESDASEADPVILDESALDGSMHYAGSAQIYSAASTPVVAPAPPPRRTREPRHAALVEALSGRAVDWLFVARSSEHVTILAKRRLTKYLQQHKGLTLSWYGPPLNPT